MSASLNKRLLVVLFLMAFGGLIACNCAGIPQQFGNKPGDPKNAIADVKPRFVLDSELLDTWGKQKTGPRQLSVTPDGKYLLALAHTNTENIQVWDLTTLKKVRGIRADNGTMHAHCAVASDSRTAAYMQFFPKASLTIFDMITGDKKCTIDDDDHHLISQSPYRCMQFSPDGTRLALACKSAIVFWDTSTGKIAATWPGRAYSLSPYFANGTRIASSSGNVVSIWDVEQGKVIKTFLGGTSAFAITPDEKTVFSQDGFVRIWDLSEGNLRK